MKMKNWLTVLLILACLGGLYGYRVMDDMRTDTQAPEIRMDGSIPQVSVKDSKEALLAGITARDAKDGDVTDSLVVESINLLSSDGRLMIGYAAFDKSGNVAKAQREARYTDYESPKFTMNGPLLYPFASNFDILSTVGATDVIDGDIQHRVRATALVENSIAEMGTHDVRFQVTNSLGDMVDLVLPVEVYDPEPYDATLLLKTPLVYLEKGSSFIPASYLRMFYLRGEEMLLMGNLPQGFSMKTEGNVNTMYPGVYPVKYRVTYTIEHETDPERDQHYTGYSKLIVVVEG